VGDTPDLKLQLGVGSSHSGRQFVPVSELKFALFEQRLGAQRRFSRHPHSALTMGALSLQMAHSSGGTRIERARLRLYEKDSLPISVPAARKSLLDAFGKRVGADLIYDSVRAYDLMLRSRLAYRLLLVSDSYLANFLSLRISSPSSFIFTAEGRHAYLALQGALEGRLHLFGQSSNVLRLDASVTGYASLGSDQEGWGYHIELSAEFWMTEISGTPLLLWLAGSFEMENNLLDTDVIAPATGSALVGVRY
jgi:hypothetical protein